jgi:hypothetical protein
MSVLDNSLANHILFMLSGCESWLSDPHNSPQVPYIIFHRAIAETRLIQSIYEHICSRTALMQVRTDDAIACGGGNTLVVTQEGRVVCWEPYGLHNVVTVGCGGGL